MDYKKLDKTTLIEYLSNIAKIKSYFGSDDLIAQEIGDGNLNYVYKISSVQNPQKALIVKQAVPYLRCVGEEFPLGRERMTYEIRALQKFYNILPSFIPNLYHTSEDMSLVVMEYLGNHVIMRKGLMDGVKYKNFSEHISTYMSAMLFYTSSLYLCSSEKRVIIAQFNSNMELCKLTEDLVFSFAFMEHETNDNANVKNNPEAQKLFADMEFKEKVLELKYRFMTQGDALLHGDLHTGSIMINENETYVIDPEFAFVGPFGFDIGALLANLVNNYIYHVVVTKDEDFQNWLLVTIKEVMEKFRDKFLNFWSEHKESALLVEGYLDNETLVRYKEKFVKNIIKESIGFAGCKMARRVYGVAGVEEIRGIEDKNLRAEAEKMALKIAREFVINYEKINSVDEILEIVKNAG
ncbi:MAG: S-methyl-5-thioribose kinase [Sulfurimonas sp. RIFOXYD12_FULL_33_39]|uniref:S-methyl-5-thioribose kinase n=1 Tax=unclassified Sulfurimonas TaxID=2623549 RepID=UPI0008BEBA24|nr:MULTISPECIES: S-methyl-5-thioribose kinase [unclassified Sulfurimonas]OHE05387.1 MAG: S-methyl-5-thioribose kinase [Sulfurimonas sp. RIFCSPLOWO2_12_FULL_34_6]OHE09861.1 MAG: S-methyl-5-thioribose kinase [Sulfurimonas sp. RIFOXYD12_FULL_33_39]OHE13631.1 MAG: S-methyl-5-thioribose kinase [Sulfurimonas sp. RIFOXYD2_FULL_34_21]DAB27360.1 MAG TPA: S-methyl-5-thioribose kinase [Sulfurimonas sp. UBA10385]